jgi:hypothetical protein
VITRRTAVFVKLPSSRYDVQRAARAIFRRALPKVLIFAHCGCALEDAWTAHVARQSFVGWSEVDLEACVGAPDQHSPSATPTFLTYHGSSTSNKGLNPNLRLPIIGGLGLSGGGYCHATFRIKNGRVVGLLYTGETDAPLAPDAYCAPIVRACIREPE